MFDGYLQRLVDRLDRRLNRRWEDAPLVDAPMASASEYRRLWDEAKARVYPPVDAFEQTAHAAIDVAWLDELALLTQITIKKSELCYQHGRLLYAVLVRYARDHRSDQLTVVETGTARGFSALCMARAMADAGAHGKIVTFDVLPHDVRFLWNCIRDVEGPCTRAELLRDYADLIERYVIFHRGDTARELGKVSFPRIHLAVLDSVHTYDHVMAEFGAIRGRQRPGDLVFFDDYSPQSYPGVVQAADQICAEQGYAKSVVSASDDRRYLVAEKT